MSSQEEEPSIHWLDEALQKSKERFEKQPQWLQESARNERQVRRAKANQLYGEAETPRTLDRSIEEVEVSEEELALLLQLERDRAFEEYHREHPILEYSLDFSMDVLEVFGPNVLWLKLRLECIEGSRRDKKRGCWVIPKRCTEVVKVVIRTFLNNESKKELGL
jgi:hypothetical protein